MVKITIKPPRLFMLHFNLLKLPFAVVVLLHLSTFIPPLLVSLLIHTDVIVFLSNALVHLAKETKCGKSESV